MEKEHVISDELINEILAALANQEYWMAYNTVSYFLEKGDVHFFSSSDEAEEFSINNISEHDCFKVIKILSVDDALRQIPYGKMLDNYLNKIDTKQSLSNSKSENFSDWKEKNLDDLKQELKELGFSERLIPAIKSYLDKPQQHFYLLQREPSENEKTSYQLFFEKKQDANEYRLTGYEAALRVAPEIPDMTIQGINAKELDKAMQTIDWSIDHHAESMADELIETREGWEELNKIDGILMDIDKLYEDVPAGKDAAEKLMYKHWFGEPWEPNTLSLDHIRQQYEWKCKVSIDGNMLQTKPETYAQLKAIALKDLKQVNKYSITNQSFIMNEQNLKYLKDNIKYLGFGDKLYPELQKNMEQGFPEFQLKTQTEFNKDKIEAALYFKKSDQTDMYFFNRYNATVEKANNETLSQTIYLNKGQGITMKEAYNLLNGRSVHKELANKEGQKYQAWVQLDFKQTDNNGNFKIKQFHQNFGYELEKALANHPIKELKNDDEKKRLIESLQKGNRQSITFIQNGNEQRMFIEANPQFKSVNVYDSNMQRVNIQSQKENNKQEQSLKQSQDKKEKQDQSGEESEEGPKKTTRQRNRKKHSIT
jgi:hypothetical protein